MKTVTIKFRNASFDVTLDEDYLIESVEYNGKEVKGLMFDLGHSLEIQQLAEVAYTEHEMESAMIAVEAAREMSGVSPYIYG